jgi:hypothetical protein
LSARLARSLVVASLTEDRGGGRLHRFRFREFVVKIVGRNAWGSVTTRPSRLLVAGLVALTGSGRLAEALRGDRDAEVRLYWGSLDIHGSSTSIERANLNGTGINEHFIEGATNPSGIAVDGNHIYWTNYGHYQSNQGSSIGRANLDGSRANEHFITGSQNACGLAIAAGHIYWGNSGSDNGTTIGRANLDGSHANQKFITGANGPCGVAAG